MKDYRKDFPILDLKVNGHNLIYFDNAATTQRPVQVIEAVKRYDLEANGNPHRGAHHLSIAATEVYEGTRAKVRKFLNARSDREIIFTKNTTESINLVAYSYGLNRLKKGDRIVLSICEHHSNLVPWQYVAKKTGAELVFMYVDGEGRLPSEEMDKIDSRTKLVGCTHMSNALSTIFPVEEIVKRAHAAGAVVLIDGAQAVPHMKVDVQALGADFYAFSGHKMMAQLGIGVLYGREEIMKDMEPFLFGGDMIEYVLEQDTSYNELPFKFEAGTQNVEGVASLGAAIDYMEEVTYDYIHDKEVELTAHALEAMKKIPFLTLIGPKDVENRGAVISFVVDGVHPHDVSTILDSYGIAVRAGHHCAQPLMKHMGVQSTNRVSFYFYNTTEEIDFFVEKLYEVRRVMGYGAE